VADGLADDEVAADKAQLDAAALALADLLLQHLEHRLGAQPPAADLGQAAVGRQRHRGALLARRRDEPGVVVAVVVAGLAAGAVAALAALVRAAVAARIELADDVGVRAGGLL
jgi:hypothetical protein